MLAIAVASCCSKKFHILTNFAKWMINWFLNRFKELGSAVEKLLMISQLRNADFLIS